MIAGLETLYDPNKTWWFNPTLEKPNIRPDPWGGKQGHVYNGVFDGSADFEAVETLYRLLLEEATRALRRREPDAKGKPQQLAYDFAAVETGTADGLSTCFLARALADVGVGHVWTGEFETVRSTGDPRPWPRLWRELGLGQCVVPCVGDTRELSTWTQHDSGAGPKFPSVIDFAFIDSEHNAVTPTREWNLLKQRLRPGGLIAFHDTLIFEDVAGVVHAVAEELGGVTIDKWLSLRGLWSLRIPADFVPKPE